LGNLNEALDIAEQQSVPLKEDMALKLCPPAATDPQGKQRRNATLMRVAQLVENQTDYKLAAKIYTMANEKINGIKCLRKTGDIKAVISFA